MLGRGFINQPAGQVFAKFKDENPVYRIGTVLPPKIARLKAIDFKTLQLWPQFLATDLRRITLADKTSQKPLVLDYNFDRNSWTAMLDGVDITEDIDRMVLDGFGQYLGRPPRGEDWTPKTPIAEHLLSDPEVMITIDMVDPQDASVPRRIVFRATSTNQAKKFYYGQVNDGKDVIFLKGETLRYLTLPLRRVGK